MAMRVFIGVGHGGSDPGAVGIVHEANANLTIGLELQRILEANGFTVGISRTRDENDDLPEEIAEANAFGPDLAIEVHNNAGGGDGWECYVQTNGYAAKSKAAAQAIEKRVKAIGQQSRGLKTKKNSSGTADYFGWLRQVNAPAILTEGFFVDSSDAYDFDTVAEQKALANAYALGVMDYFGISTSASPNTSVSSGSTGQLYRVRKTWGNAKSQIGAYKNLDGAKKACKAGYKVFDKSGNVVYDPASASTSTATTTAQEHPQFRDSTKANGVKYNVTALSGLNMRAGAGVKNTKTGKDNAVIATLKYGSVVWWYGYYTTVQGVDWYWIKTESGQTGFVSSQYLRS